MHVMVPRPFCPRPVRAHDTFVRPVPKHVTRVRTAGSKYPDFREGTELAQHRGQEGPVPAPLSHPESAAHEAVPVTRPTRSWVYVVLTGLVLAATPFGVELAGPAIEIPERLALVPAPSQPPARIVAHAPRKGSVEWRRRGAIGYRVFRGVAACGAPSDRTVGSRTHQLQDRERRAARYRCRVQQRRYRTALGGSQRHAACQPANWRRGGEGRSPHWQPPGGHGDIVMRGISGTLANGGRIVTDALRGYGLPTP